MSELSELNELAIDRKHLKVILDELSGITDTDFSKIISCLRNAKPFQSESSFVVCLNNEKVSLSSIEKANLLELLEMLYIMRRKLGMVSSEQIIDFVFGATRDHKRDYKKINERVNGLQLVAISINLIAKSKDLWKELPRKLYSSIILTDFRPFFSDGKYISSEYGPSIGDMAVENGCIVHTLKLNYEEEGIGKQFHVSLDKNGLLKMQSEINRALAKEESLSRMMKKIDVQIHERKG